MRFWWHTEIQDGSGDRVGGSHCGHKHWSHGDAEYCWSNRRARTHLTDGHKVVIVKNAHLPAPDVHLIGDGGGLRTVYLLNAVNEDAREWLKLHTDGEWLGTALAVETRYVGDLVEGLQEAGFTVA